MIRKALVQEVPEIRRLLMEFSSQWNVLPRTLADLYSLVRDYFVYRPDQGPILGIAALHVFWEDLGEIRSLVVVPESQQQGIGTGLVEKCLEEARALGLKQVFVLTSEGHGKFFARVGFHQISRHKLPEIIWAECAQCFKYPECDEVPMLLDL